METETTTLTWYDNMIAKRRLSRSDAAILQAGATMSKIKSALTAIKDEPNPKQFNVKSHDKITAFIGLINDGIQSWEKAGKMLVEMEQDDPDIKIKIRREDPRISLSILEKLEQVGLGKIKAELFMLPADQQRKMALLPPAMQTALLTGSVPVINRNNGEFVQQAKRLDEMTQSEFRRCIDPSGVVPAKQQIAELQKQEARAKQLEARWIFEDGHVVFLYKCRVNAEQLRSILERLESIKPSAGEIETAIKKRQIAK